LTDLGLYHGKMGIILFFVHYARYTGEDIYDKFAGELLDEIFHEIHDEIPINFESGLCGIGWGIEYLLKNRFMEGNPNEILTDIDQKIMEKDIKRIKDESLKTGLQGIFYYVKKRLNSNCQKKGRVPFDERYLADWAFINKGWKIPEDTKLLSDIINELPSGESITEWQLALEKGCGGYGLKKIFL